MTASANASPRLFIKPAVDTDEVLFVKQNTSPEGLVAFRSLDLDTELIRIHEWVNRWYAVDFWQMNGSYHLLDSCYKCINQNPWSHSFTGYFNNNLTCQLDVYAVGADELKMHVEYGDSDCGFHLLMAPNSGPVHGLTVSMVVAFLHYYFSFAEAERLFAEPDVRNQKSVRLLERIGFDRIKTVEMSYKSAHIYLLTRKNFLARHLNLH